MAAYGAAREQHAAPPSLALTAQSAGEISAGEICLLSLARRACAAGGIGWDSFALDYHVDAPLDTIFSAEALAQYRQVTSI